MSRLQGRGWDGWEVGRDVARSRRRLWRRPRERELCSAVVHGWVARTRRLKEEKEEEV